MILNCNKQMFKYWIQYLQTWPSTRTAYLQNLVNREQFDRYAVPSLSLVALTRPIPDRKNKRPNTPKIISDLMSRLPPLVLAKTIAAYISAPIPARVSMAPKIRLIFITYCLWLMKRVKDFIFCRPARLKHRPRPLPQHQSPATSWDSWAYRV